VKTVRCHWDAQAGWLSPAHERDCDDDTCQGCRPCSDSHCGIDGCATHVDHDAGIWTCPRCIGKTRAELARIVTLYESDLPEQAEYAGINSEALNLIGPAPLLEDYETMRECTDAERGWCSWPITDQHHPYQVLGRIDMALREIYGPRTSLAVRVERAAAYITDLLAGRFPHEDQFEDAAKEIHQLRRHMESVIGNSTKPETGAPCPRCEVEIQAAPDNEREPPRLIKRYASGDDERSLAGEYDTWHCPDNGAHWWTNEDYLMTVEAVNRERVREGRWLTAAEVRDRYEVKPATLRKWASRDQVKSRWIAEQLRYDTTDVREMLAPASIAP
jgi:hypothetical protein